MLHTCYASTDRDFTSTSALKARLFGATSTSTMYDAHLSGLIRAASRWAEGYIGYPLGLASYQETVAGYGTRRLMLGRTPLRSVERVFNATDTGSAVLLTTQYRIEHRDAGFLSRDAGWEWTVPVLSDLSPHPLPGDEYKPWLVDYKAGYVYAGLDPASPNYSTANGSTDTGRTLPEDIEEAVLLRCQRIYDRADMVSGEKLADIEVNYRSGGIAGGADASDATPEALLLSPYRRVA